MESQGYTSCFHAKTGLIIKSEQIIVRRRLMAHFKALTILDLENKDSLL